MPQRFIGHRLATLYAQPFESAIACVLLISAGFMLWDSKFTPTSISALEYPWSVLFRGMMLLAGVLMLCGLLRGKHRWSFGLEMTGMILAAVVFVTYAAGLGLSISTGGARAVMGCATYGVISLACVIKSRALWIESHNRLQLIKELPLPDRQGDSDG